MALPLVGPLRDLLRAQADDAVGRAAEALVSVIFLTVAVALLVSAGLVALTQEIGFPTAAVVFAAAFASLALVVRSVGRMLSTRRSARVAAARARAEADVALATALARSARPLLPIAAFLAAFALARRS